MINTTIKLSCGRYLKTARLEKGIDLETISKETKIGLDTLGSIENDDYTHLPSEVYVKGFIRAYAQAIGADVDEAIERYVSRIPSRKHGTNNANANIESSKPFWLRFVGVMVLFFGLMVMSILCLESFF